MIPDKNNKNWISHATGAQDVADIREYLSNRADRLGISESITYNMLLAVTEIVENIIIHGYNGQAGYVSAGMEREDDKLIVRIHDRAPVFDPRTAPAPDLSIPLEIRTPGGLGIFLTREMVDQIGHRALPRGGNEFTLIIKLNERNQKYDGHDETGG